jgi:AAA15 family ATPase/GTPase
MYQSFQAKNFRCFEDLKIRDLARVNLIAGLNNIGKTALLEGDLVNKCVNGF